MAKKTNVIDGRGDGGPSDPIDRLPVHCDVFEMVATKNPFRAFRTLNGPRTTRNIIIASLCVYVYTFRVATKRIRIPSQSDKLLPVIQE